MRFRWEAPSGIPVETRRTGGNIRVGLEGDLYMSRGVWATSSQRVERAYTLVNAVGGYEVATPAETREILKLRTRAHDGAMATILL